MFDAEQIQSTAHDLAGMSGVDIDRASPKTRKLWEARGLAMHHLAAGDMAEAKKVMAVVLPGEVAQ